ncbi:MAG: glycosyltransferase family 9 protein [Thermodesulfobacteriota bacterium]
MDINLVRRIDYYLGIPLSFILTIIHRLAKILRKNPDIPPLPRNVLFIELSEMGSAILAYSAMRQIKQLYPQASLYFTIFEKNRASVEILNIIDPDKIFTIRDDSFIRFTFDTIKVLFKSRINKIDTVIDLELFSRFSNLLSYLSGANNRVGFNNYYGEGLYRGDWQTHKVYYNPHRHMALNFLALVQSLNSDTQDIPLLKVKIDEHDVILPRVAPDETRQQDLWAKLKQINPDIRETGRIIIINPNAGTILPVRAWPLASYVELVKRLLQDENHYIIITGNHEARDDAQTITAAVQNRRCLNLVEKTSFQELLDLYHLADLLITNDSGPAHFASLTPISTMVFFGPETPLLYKPLGEKVHVFYSSLACSPCLTAFNHRHTPCRDNKCLKSIGVEEVYSCIREQLNEKKI